VTDDPDRFAAVGDRFFGRPMEKVERIVL
jgi:hypothetical protein